MKELDTVELGAASGRWPAGTVGTVLELFDAAALVEISDERGHAVDFLTVPFDVLRVTNAAVQESLGV